MCELFGAILAKPKQVNKYLETFYSHCDEHPHGWGLARLSGTFPQIEKAAVRADKSETLRKILDQPVVEKQVLVKRYEDFWNLKNKSFSNRKKDMPGFFVNSMERSISIKD